MTSDTSTLSWSLLISIFESSQFAHGFHVRARPGDVLSTCGFGLASSGTSLSLGFVPLRAQLHQQWSDVGLFDSQSQESLPHHL